MPLLEMQGLTKEFGGLTALSKLDVNIDEGEIVGLVGPNGSGKTTWINIVTGFLKPTAGDILYKGQSIVGLEPYQIAERGIIRTFQLTSLFPDLTVKENIVRGRHLSTNSSILGSFFWSKGYRKEEAKLRQEVMEILSFVKMQEKSDMAAQNLPAAEQRVLEIAIALAAKPELLFLDEPTSGMNLQEAARTMELIQSIRQMGTTVVIVEHNMKVIMELCSRIVVLNQGIKIAEGTPEEIIMNEEVISVYLGKRRGKNA